MNSQHSLLIDARLRRAPWRQAASPLEGRLLALIGGLLLLITAAALLYLSQASVAAELRYQLWQTKREQMELEEEIALLRVQIASADGCQALEQRALRLGLVDAPLGGPYLVCEIPAAPKVASNPPIASQPAQSAALEHLLARFVPSPKLQAMRISMPQR